MHVRKFEFNHIGENTYVVYDETNEAVIIDCGVYFPEEKETLKQFILDNNLHLSHLLNTHLHMDHAFGNYFIYETYGLRPEYHQKEEAMPGLKEQAGFFGINIKDEPLEASRYINEGDTITFGRICFKALLVPGHSPGSLCYYSEKDKCVFVGDVLFRGNIGRSDLWGGDPLQLISGIKEKLLTLPENTIVYPGHGPKTTIGEEKQQNPFL